MPVAPADPAYRRNAIACFVVMIAIGAAALLWGRPVFIDWLASQDPRDAVRAMQISFAAAFVPAIPMGLALLRLSRRIRASGQFPPPGMRVLVDTVIVTGAAARRQARGFLAVAVFICLASVTGMIVMPIVVARILAAP
jgi:hypothetical protein